MEQNKDMGKEPELTRMQRPKVEAYCKARGLTNPYKKGTSWYACNNHGMPALIPMSAYKPPFPG